MQISTKARVLVLAVFMIFGLAGCVTTNTASTGGGTPVSIEPIELEGSYFEFPEPVDDNPQAMSLNREALQEKYKGISNTANMVANPDFEIEGKVGGFVGNWGSGNWKEPRYTAKSPGTNPPALRCCYLPRSDGVKDVMQRVPVEPGAWYYISFWTYWEENGTGNMTSFAIYGNPNDGYGPKANARVNINARNYMGRNVNVWTKSSFIVQIPEEMKEIPGAKNPHLDIRFRQAPDADTPPLWFTKVEIHKLLPESVEPM